MVEFRLEDHEADPVPRFINERKARGLAPPATLAAHRDGFLQKRKQTGALYIFHFLRYLFFFVLGVSHKSGPLSQLCELGDRPRLMADPKYMLSESSDIS